MKIYTIFKYSRAGGIGILTPDECMLGVRTTLKSAQQYAQEYENIIANENNEPHNALKWHEVPETHVVRAEALYGHCYVIREFDTTEPPV